MTSKKVRTMSERATATVSGEHLPREFRTLLTARPLAAHRYRVTVEEVVETDDEKREALRNTLKTRISEADAGHVIDGETVFSMLQDKHFPNLK